jgi:hypothetical protein
MGNRILAFTGCLVVAAATAACAGTLEDPGQFLIYFEDGGGDDGATGSSTDPNAGNCTDIPQLFASTCTSSTCHSASNKAQGLDLESPNPGARLVGASATEGPGLLIDPSAPSKSIIYLKLSSSPPFGARMPLGEKPLSGATLACVYSWIAEQTTATASDAGAGSEAGAVGDGGSE